MTSAFVDLLLENENLTNGELLLEFELFLIDVYRVFGKLSRFKAHNRIVGQSRQISNLLLSDLDKASPVYINKL